MSTLLHIPRIVAQANRAHFKQYLIQIKPKYYHTTVPSMFRITNPLSGLFGSKPGTVENSLLPPVKVYNLQEDKDKRTRRLVHLIRANHINHSVIYHHLIFHNHAPHILGSAYIFGANDEQLNKIYDAESEELQPWKDSPSEITKEDWRRHFGDPKYQRAYLDFFEDELVHEKYDWKVVLKKYLHEGDEPLINGLIGGLGHPLIHLGYAIELDNRELAMEALTMGVCAYNHLHTYVDGGQYPLPFMCSKVPLDLLNRIQSDDRFDGLFDHPAYSNEEKLFDQEGPRVLEFFNALRLDMENLANVFEGLVDAAVLLNTTGHKPNKPAYDFFVLHLLTTAHALRIVLPLLTLPQAKMVIRSHWVLFVVVYFIQMRPKIKPELLTEYDIANKDWDYVTDKALNGPHKHDAHYVKGLRAFKEFDTLFGSKDGMYLKAAVKMADEFNGWTFEEPDLDIRNTLSEQTISLAVSTRELEKSA